MRTVMIKGYSKTGKTATVTALIEEFRKRGYTVGTVKDISDYKHYNEADRIICVMNYQVLRSVFVYKRWFVWRRKNENKKRGSRNN